MGAPSITISFIEKAMTAVTRGERGIVMLWVKDTLAAPAVNPVTVNRERHTGQLKRCNGRTDQTCNDWLHKCPEEGNCVLHGNCRRRRKSGDRREL